MVDAYGKSNFTLVLPRQFLVIREYLTSRSDTENFDLSTSNIEHLLITKEFLIYLKNHIGIGNYSPVFLHYAYYKHLEIFFIKICVKIFCHKSRVFKCRIQVNFKKTF